MKTLGSDKGNGKNEENYDVTREYKAVNVNVLIFLG